MTKRTAEAVANARADESPDYLNTAIKELADIYDAAKRQNEKCICSCNDCMSLQRAFDRMPK